MLIGQFIANLGEKHRVSVPKKFREELGSKLIVAKWYENCLVLISQTKWEAFIGKLTGKSAFFTSPVRDTDRFILGSASECETDSLGRIVLPKYLMEYANLKSEVVFLGLLDRIEIWDANEWSKREKLITQSAPNLIETIAKEV